MIPDRPGFGLSGPHDYRRVDYRADATRWLLDLTDALGAEQIDLVGGSMGGFLAIAFAAAHPERVRRLVLSGAPGGLFPRMGLFLQLWATPGIGALISRIKFRDTETLRKRAFGGYLVRPDRLSADLLAVALAGINLPGTAETNRAILRAVATLRGWRPDMRLDDALAALQVPTLFVWGSCASRHPKERAVHSAAQRAPRSRARQDHEGTWGCHSQRRRDPWPELRGLFERPYLDDALGDRAWSP